MRKTTPPSTCERSWDPYPEDLLPQLPWIGDGSVVEHRTCAKLRGVAPTELDVVGEDFYMTLRSATEARLHQPCSSGTLTNIGVRWYVTVIISVNALLEGYILGILGFVLS
jgi:hypothetical protein